MIVIVRCGIGNVGSVQNMFKKIGVEVLVSNNERDIDRASKLILPGVGAFDAGISALEQSGLIPAISRVALQERKPVLGICLGMQLLMQHSEEGSRSGLGWIRGKVVRFPSQVGGKSVKIPHMGWSRVQWRSGFPLANGASQSERYYFVHSFHVVCQRAEDIAGTTQYAGEFTAAVACGNIFGVQFHPEKSHVYGMRLLRNFASI